MDIEREYTHEYSLVNTAESTTPKITNKDFLFHVLAICGLLLYVGTNLYISFIADYQLFIWHPVLMVYTILFSTQGKRELLLR
jgi:hypothetical protein